MSAESEARRLEEKLGAKRFFEGCQWPDWDLKRFQAQNRLYRKGLDDAAGKTIKIQYIPPLDPRVITGDRPLTGNEGFLGYFGRELLEEARRKPVLFFDEACDLQTFGTESLYLTPSDGYFDDDYDRFFTEDGRDKRLLLCK